MTLVLKQPTTIVGYNTIADRNDEEDTGVSDPFVPHTSIRSGTKIDDHGRKTKHGYGGPILAAIVLTLTTLLVGRSVSMGGGPSYDGGGDSLRRSAGNNLVDGTPALAHNEDSTQCRPATGTFGGYSMTLSGGLPDPFETCWLIRTKGNPIDAGYCWTKSWYCGPQNTYYKCAPDVYDAEGEGKYNWEPMDARNVRPYTEPNRCGLPCQDVYAELQ